MAVYVNMDKKHLRNGGRKAPTMSKEQFLVMLTKALDLSPDKYIKDNFEYRLAEASYGEELPGFAKMAADLGKIHVDRENFIPLRVIQTDSGIPAVLVMMGGDWEVPVRCFVYYDGKVFRSYIPTYGNSFNVYAKAAFGSEMETGRLYIGKKYELYKEASGSETVCPKTEDEYEAVGWASVTANEDACIEDFASRVVPTGHIDDNVTAIQELNPAGCGLLGELFDTDSLGPDTVNGNRKVKKLSSLGDGMLRLEDINTLERAQAFLLMFAHEVENQPIDSACRNYKVESLLPTRAEQLMRHGVISEELGRKYIETFDTDFTNLTIMSVYSTQLEFLLKDTAFDQKVLFADCDGYIPHEKCMARIDDCMALLYAVEFLDNDDYRCFVWQEFMEWLKYGAHNPDVDLTLAGLDAYRAKIAKIQLPLQA